MKIEKPTAKQRRNKKKQWKSPIPGGNAITHKKKVDTWYPNRIVATTNNLRDKDVPY